MRFSELVRLLEANGFALIRQRVGSLLWKGRLAATDPGGVPRAQRSAHGYLSRDLKGRWHFQAGTATARRTTAEGRIIMIELPYSLVIEATEEPDFFGYYSEELEGFSGIGHSVEDCLYRAKWGMKEHLELMTAQGLPVPARNADPIVTIRNEQQEAA